MPIQRRIQVASRSASMSIQSIPEEILMDIIRFVHQVNPWPAWPVDQKIRFANNQVLHLSQASHQFRRLCLSLLYERIIVRLTDADIMIPPVATHATQLNIFRRIMECKPQLARLVRRVEIRCSGQLVRLCTFDSLPFLPNVTHISLSHNIKLDLNFLSIINSHPHLHTAQWDSTESFAHPYTLFLPSSDLSRVLVTTAYLSSILGSNTFLWQCFSTLGLRTNKIVVTEDTPIQFLSLTYPDLREIHVVVHPNLNSDGPDPLAWFASFMERHPQLVCINVDFRACAPPLAWEALKNIPDLGLLYDTVHKKELSSLFSLKRLVTKIERPATNYGPISEATIDIDSSHPFLDIIPCLGSFMNLPRKLSFHFRERLPQSPAIDVNDFVSALQEHLQCLESLSLTNIHRALDFDDERYFVAESTAFNDDVNSYSNRKETNQVAQLACLLATRLIQLDHIEFWDDELDMEADWDFSIWRDQGQVRVVNQGNLVYRRHM